MGSIWNFGRSVLLYCMMCDFTPSVVRASIMSLVFALSAFMGKRYDALSSLSLTGIILFLCNPFALFSIGFQLSFTCVFAIITLSPWFTKKLNMLKIPNSISSIIALNLATNIAIIPFCAFYFHKISLLSILANLLVLPIFNATYLILLCITIISLIIPIFSYILIIPDILLHIIKHIANFVANIPHSYLIIFGAGIISFISIFCMMYILQFFVGKQKIKFILCIVFSSVFLLSTLIHVFPKNYDKSVLVAFKQYYSNSVLVVDKSEVSYIGFHEKDYTKIEEQLMNYKIKQIDNLFLFEYTSDVKKLNAFILNYNIKNVYIPTSFTHLMLSKFEIITSSVAINNYNFEFVYRYEDALGVQIKGNEKNIFITNDLSIANCVYISNTITEDFDYFFINNLKNRLTDYLEIDILISQYNTNCLSNYELDKDNMVSLDI